MNTMIQLLSENQLQDSQNHLVKSCMGVACIGDERYLRILKEAGFGKSYHAAEVTQVRNTAHIILDMTGDTVNIWIPTDRGHEMLSPKQMDVLLLDFICRMRRAMHEENMPLYIPSRMITSGLGDKVAKSYGIIEVEDDKFLAYDKGAMAVFVCEAAAYYRRLGKSLLMALNDLYTLHGYYKEYIDNFPLNKEILNGTKQEIEELRNRVTAGEETFVGGMQIKGFVQVTDKKVRCLLKDGSKFSVRLKKGGDQLVCHYVVIADTASGANHKLQSLRLAIRQTLRLT